jgi:hypothetical protein
MKIEEQSMSNKLVRYFKEDAKIPGHGALIASLAVNIILLYVVNNLRYFGIPQLIEANLVSCLWALNIVFGLAIIGNFVLLINRTVWFFHFVQMLINAAGVNAFFFIYKQYPFNLGSSILDTIVRIILILIMIGFFLTFLIEFFRCGINFSLPKKKVVPAPALISPEASQLAGAEAGSQAVESNQENKAPGETFLSEPVTAPDTSTTPTTEPNLPASTTAANQSAAAPSANPPSNETNPAAPSPDIRPEPHQPIKNIE